MNKQEQHNYYGNLAILCANNSKAKKLKVGAIIVKDGQIMSDGFNGTPSGFDNQCEDYICTYCKGDYCHINNPHTGEPCNEICKFTKLQTRDNVIHAESNAILKCAKFGRSTLGADIYITHAPCIECAKLIIQAGIKNVYYIYDYHHIDGIQLIMDAKINIKQIKLY